MALTSNTTTIQSILSTVNSLPSAPSGSISITANGTYDVTTKASVAVNVDYPYPLFCPSDYSDGMQTSKGRDFCCEVA